MGLNISNPKLLSEDFDIILENNKSSAAFSILYRLKEVGFAPEEFVQAIFTEFELSICEDTFSFLESVEKQ